MPARQLGRGRAAALGRARQPRAEPRPAPRRSLPKRTKGLSAEHLKFNLHADVSVSEGLPAARERLLRYCARPPLALERLSVLDDGRICYRIKDTDHVRLMTPVQFQARLAALVPPPRHPLVRFYGVWASHSHWRSRVVTAAPAQTTRVTCAASTSNDSCASPVTSAGVTVIDGCGETAPAPTPDGAKAPSVPHSSSPKPLRPSAAVQPSAEPEPLGPLHVAGEELRFRRLSRLAWATLYQRVFDIEPLECSSCGGRMRFVEVIEDIARAQRAPPSKPARAATAAVSRTLTRLVRLIPRNRRNRASRS